VRRSDSHSIAKFCRRVWRDAKEHREWLNSHSSEVVQNTNNVIAGIIPTEITPALMVEWFNTKAKQSVSLLELADLFLEEGANEGIRGDIAFCQSIKETGWFRFGGQVLPEQALAPPITVQWGRAQGSAFGRRFST
jgi:hypothetical protein